MENIWKQIPNSNWLMNLDEYRIKEKPGKHPHFGPWYSDDGEDGVIEYLFNYINDTYKFAIDIGAAHGYGGSQIRHIADKYNWKTTELDGSKRWNIIHPAVKEEWITKDNIDALLLKYKTPMRIDLLSLDVDSMDYWILEKVLIAGYRPSAAVIEYNPIFEYNEAYVRIHDYSYTKDSTSRYGASLKAYELLMNRYNYTLIHVFGKTESMEANNCIFLDNAFILPNTRIKNIQEFHPFSWIESHKKKNPKLPLNDLKKLLIDKNIFEKIIL